MYPYEKHTAPYLFSQTGVTPVCFKTIASCIIIQCKITAALRMRKYLKVGIFHVGAPGSAPAVVHFVHFSKNIVKLAD